MMQTHKVLPYLHPLSLHDPLRICYWLFGLEMATEKGLAEAVGDLHRVARVLGAEDEGLRRLTREKCDFLAKLPMSGAVESLNVSAAAAVALYECVRG